jgi:hypothetical protein
MPMVEAITDEAAASAEIAADLRAAAAFRKAAFLMDTDRRRAA